MENDLKQFWDPFKLFIEIFSILMENGFKSSKKRISNICRKRFRTLIEIHLSVYGKISKDLLKRFQICKKIQTFIENDFKR